MSTFQQFLDSNGPPIECEKATQGALSQYRDQLPAQLVSFWEEQGWCGFAKGLIWVVDPSKFSTEIEEWIEPSDEPPIVLARTAFCDLYFWGKNGVYRVDVQHGDVSHVVNDITVFFDEFLCDPNVLDKVLKRPLFVEAMKESGPLDHNTCFAFEPALVLGGSGEASTIKRVKLREHLHLLAQIVLG